MSKTNKNWFLLVRNDVKKTLDTDLDTEITASEMYYVHRLSATVLPAQGNRNRVDGSPDVGVSQNWV